MLTLFPKFKTRLILFEGLFVALMAALYLLKPTMNPIALILMLIVGCLFIAAAQYINAANTHSRQLNRLYNQLDVDGFLKEYEPHLQQNPKNPNLYMMVRLHLSNAYAAQGRFGDAMKLLAATEIREGKKPEQALMSRFAVTSNLCYCAEQMGDLDAAKKYLDELHGYKKQLEAIQATKKPKQRMAFSCELNDQCMKLLSTGNATFRRSKRRCSRTTPSSSTASPPRCGLRAPIWPSRTAARPRTSSSRSSSSRPISTPAGRPPACSPSCPPRRKADCSSLLFSAPRPALLRFRRGALFFAENRLFL